MSGLGVPQAWQRTYMYMYVHVLHTQPLVTDTVGTVTVQKIEIQNPQISL